MKRILWISAALLLFSLPALAQDAGRDPAFEQAIYDRLAAVNADAVNLFRDATEALDSGDMVTAETKFTTVLDLAPDFPDVLRRLSYVENSLGNSQEAVSLARRAYAIDDGPDNQAALAAALIAVSDTNPEVATEALQLARSSVAQQPDEAYANLVLLYAGVLSGDQAAVRQGAEALGRLMPEAAISHYWMGLLAADDGQWERAEAELLHARDLGWPADQVQQALDRDISTQALIQRVLRSILIIGLGWVLGMAILFMFATILSRLTLAAINETQTTASLSPGPRERSIRSIYRAVIVLSVIYYYLSLPVLILVVLGLAGGIIYLFYMAGSIPIRIAAVVVFIGFATLVAIVRSVFSRTKQADPGRPLLPEDAPDLWAVTREVAAKVGTSPISAIFVVPGTEIGVLEHGSMLQQLRGEGQRRLILGLGALDGMNQAQFKAILAHEYGHFSNRDTAGGGLALQVRLSMLNLVRHLALSGQARWFNPAWIFLNVFNRVFLRMTLGASRLQEVLADRYAALAYGARNFAEALTHIVRRSILFDMQVSHEINQILSEPRAMHNLYTLPDLEDESKFETAFEEVLQRPTSAYDSHPALKDRIRWTEQIQSAVSQEGNDCQAWALIPDAESLQAEMTQIIYERVLTARHPADRA